MTTKIAYRQIEDVIADRLCAQSFIDRARLASRLKQLRNIANIPRAGTTNVGSRARYGLADIVQVALVFECVQRSVATLRAAMVVTTYWQDFEDRVCAAWKKLVVGDGEGYFALLFLEDIDGFTKRDNIIDWVNFEGTKLASGDFIIPLVVFGLGSELFPKNATGQFPGRKGLPSQEGATLVHLTTFVKNLVARLERHGVCTELEFTNYCETVLARPKTTL